MKDALTDIRGIGGAKAEAIMAIVDEHTTEGVDRDLVARAYDKLQSGRDDLAADALERALDG